VGRLPTFLMAIAFLFLPFFFLHQTIDPVLLPRFVALAVLLLLITSIMLLGPRPYLGSLRRGIHRRVMVVALGGYLIISLISLTQAANIAEGLFELLKIFLLFVSFLIFSLVLGQDRRAVGLVCRSMTLAAAGLSLIGLAQFHGLAFTTLPGNGIPYATMANRNMLASALCLMFPFAFFLVLRGRSFWRVTAILTAILSIVVILLGNVRAAWAAMTIATLVSLIIWITNAGHLGLPSRRRATYRKKIIVFAVLLILVVLVFGSLSLKQDQLQAMYNRVVAVATLSGGSISARLDLWKNSWAMFADHPLLGVGPGNWKLQIPRYGAVSVYTDTGEIFYQRPHNDYLWVLTESGILALICYLTVFAAAFVCCLRVIRRSTDEDDVLLATLMAFGLTALLTLAFFSFPRERIVHTMLTSLMLAVVLITYVRTFPQSCRPSRPALSLVLSGSLLGLALCVLVGGSRLRSEVHTRRALEARMAVDRETVITEIDRAKSPFGQIDPTSTPLAWYRGTANFSLGRLDQAFADFSEAHRVNPYHLHVLNNLAACYARKGEYKTAIDYYGRALELWPSFEETLLNLAATYYNAGLYHKALSTLQRIKGGSKDPRYELYLEKVQDKLEHTPPE